MANKTAGISPDVFRNTVIDRNGQLGESACEIMSAAINATDPYKCVKDYVQLTDAHIHIGDDKVRLKDINRIFVIGLGKASVPMAKALIDKLGNKLQWASVVTKAADFINEDGYRQKLKVYPGGHPIPSVESIISTKNVLQALPELTSNDLVLVLISGGGSALFTHPIEGMLLDDYQSLTDVLIKVGADIQEINTIRKHLDLVKGGRLIELLQPAMTHSLILSDVIGDRVDMIASGPTAPDPTTYQDAWHIIVKYRLEGRVPKNILDILQMGIRGIYTETLKEIDFNKYQVKNHLVGSNIMAVEAAKSQAQRLGFNCVILSTHLTGSTEAVANLMDGIILSVLKHGYPVQRPACLLFGGETTVEVRGKGLGGRNQDLTMRMVRNLAGKEGVLFISLATDGEDGPTDAAGAASDAKVFRDDAAMFVVNLDTNIETNNSYHYFDNNGGLIKTGSTGSNVNDLVIILIGDPIDP